MRFPALAGRIGRHFDWLADADELEFERLTEGLAELSSGSNDGLYLRQLPIAGIDSKWIGVNRGLVTELLRPLLGADRGEDATGDLWSIAGLRREPSLLRLRLLDARLRAGRGYRLAGQPAIFDLSVPPRPAGSGDR